MSLKFLFFKTNVLLSIIALNINEIHANHYDYDNDYHNDNDYDYKHNPYMTESRNSRQPGNRVMSYESSISGRKGKAKQLNEDVYEDLLDPNLSIAEADAMIPSNEKTRFNPRSVGGCPDQSCWRCLDSCRHLKRSKVASNAITQYTFLRLCSSGCKEEFPCLIENFCLPVMAENPDYFVQCTGQCNLFQIVPKIFKTGKYC